MNYEQFLEALAEDITRSLGDKYPGISVSVTEVSKLQGRSYRGLQVTGVDPSMGMSADMSNFYEQLQNGVPYEEVCETVIRGTDEKLAEMPRYTAEDLASYDSIKDKLIIEVVSTKDNAEMLKDIPHREIEDMSEVYRFVLNDSEKAQSSVLVTNVMLQVYGITPEQVRADAIAAGPENNPYSIASLYDVMREMMGDMFPAPAPDEPQIYVASNDSKMFGAGAIAYPGFMEEAKEAVGGSFYVLPSSIHEVLLVPDRGDHNYRELLGMVTSVNATEVAPEDKLTDNVYHYDAKTRVFETAKTHEERSHAKGSLMKDLNGRKEECRSAPKRPDRKPARSGMAL